MRYPFVVLDAASFEMAEFVSQGLLRRHPVWLPYRGAPDRERILGWGVSAEALDREIGRFEFCGTEPFYPVLVLESLPDDPGLVLRARFESRGGAALDGYLAPPHAFGVFVGERELCFNRTLPFLAERTARELALALAAAEDEVFPLRYAAELGESAGGTVEGELDPRPGPGG